MKDKLQTCPLCSADLPPTHRLRLGGMASIMASKRWKKTTKKQRSEHGKKMVEARIAKKKLLTS